MDLVQIFSKKDLEIRFELCVCGSTDHVTDIEFVTKFSIHNAYQKIKILN